MNGLCDRVLDLYDGVIGAPAWCAAMTHLNSGIHLKEIKLCSCVIDKKLDSALILIVKIESNLIQEFAPAEA